MGTEHTKVLRAELKTLKALPRNKYRFQEYYQNEPWDGKDQPPESRQFEPWDGENEAVWMNARKPMIRSFKF